MWFSVSGILVLFLYVNPIVSRDVCSDGMIKEAILSLARIIRDNSQKTERHEMRERHQGDYLKKAMDDLTKKVSILDTFITHFSKVEDQISEIEQLISQRDERERIQMQKTADSIQNLESRLESRLDEIKNTISEVSKHAEPTEPTPTTESVSASDILSKLNDTEAHFTEQIAQIQSSLQTMAIENKADAAKQAQKEEIAANERSTRERIMDEKRASLMEDLENRLIIQLEEIKSTINEANERVEPTTPSPTTESVSASDIIAKLNDTEVNLLKRVGEIKSNLDTMGIENKEEAATQAENLQTVFTEVKNITGRLQDIESLLEEAEEAAKREKEKPEEPKVDIAAIIQVQGEEIKRVSDFVENTLNRIRDLPMTSELEAMHNETQRALEEAKLILESEIRDEINGIVANISEKNEEIKDSIGDLRLDLANNTQHVNKKLNDLTKGQGVMVSMGDEVLDTKKRVEYGVHQILVEVGELIKSHNTEITKMLNDKFDGISNDIITNNSLALANLTSSMEEEIGQVWRQITVMYQQMIKNAIALDKLNEQNEAYVNGTISTMDGMETKVGDIKKRMSEVDANLNYLLGRLSLVTQQFNQIKTGLGAALDEIKASFKEVQEKADGLNYPGPHPISNEYPESGVGEVMIS